MFESEQSPVDASALRSLLAQLAGPLDLGEDDDLAGAVDDAEVIEQIAALERVKNGAAARQARQARLAVVFDRSQRARQRAAGAAADKVGRGVGEQIALARRESPTHGSRHLGLAKALVNEMPHTMAALSAGWSVSGRRPWRCGRPPAWPWRTGGEWIPSWPTGCRR
jgi:hypothetical protein